MAKLTTTLSEYGCDVDQALFVDVLVEAKQALSPAWTDEELVCHPDSAKLYCDVVRHRVGCPSLPDNVILKAMLNHRKSTRK